MRPSIKDTWRHESVTKYAIVKGDFNGDGVVDEAKLLMRQDGTGFGLFAFVSQQGNLFKIYQLDEIKNNKFIKITGIKNVTNGSYKTACGKGYWDCRKDEHPEIIIKNDSIDYFKIEGANSFFYWDGNANDFKRIWISD